MFILSDDPVMEQQLQECLQLIYFLSSSVGKSRSFSVGNKTFEGYDT